MRTVPPPRLDPHTFLHRLTRRPRATGQERPRLEPVWLNRRVVLRIAGGRCCDSSRPAAGAVCRGRNTGVESGAVLADRYRLTKRLGQGGMGEVWAAEDAQLRRRVAVKIVLANLSGASTVVARLRREAENAAQLQHPGITVVHDIGEHDGHPFFVMELLDGTDFTEILARNPGGLPVDRVLETGAAVADALAYAHRRGVVHRDIKPANLMELA